MVWSPSQLRSQSYGEADQTLGQPDTNVGEGPRHGWGPRELQFAERHDSKGIFWRKESSIRCRPGFAGVLGSLVSSVHLRRQFVEPHSVPAVAPVPRRETRRSPVYEIWPSRGPWRYLDPPSTAARVRGCTSIRVQGTPPLACGMVIISNVYTYQFDDCTQWTQIPRRPYRSVWQIRRVFTGSRRWRTRGST